MLSRDKLENFEDLLKKTLLAVLFLLATVWNQWLKRVYKIGLEKAAYKGTCSRTAGRKYANH